MLYIYFQLLTNFYLNLGFGKILLTTASSTPRNKQNFMSDINIYSLAAIIALPTQRYLHIFVWYALRVYNITYERDLNHVYLFIYI